MPSVAPEALFQLRGVQKRFGELVVIDGLDLDVYRGETLSLVGNSGTGKSILVKMLIGLLEPEQGDLWFGGHHLQGLSEQEWMPIRQQVSMVFQANALFDSLTVHDNLAYPLRQHTEMPEDEISRRVTQVLSWVNLPGVEALYPSEMSGGMRKRAGVARAIITEPDVILYDEPTAGLDPISTTVIDDMIKRFQRERGVTSIVITHDLRSALSVADRVALLHEGRVHAVAPPDEILQNEDPVVYNFFEGYRMMMSLLGD
jgi:phospholipid/cholesterol/gamma-HCH transport system ATP-binding protein